MPHEITANRQHRRRAFFLTPFLLIGMASAGAAAGDKPVVLLQAQSEIPEARLLDVGIQLFDPGLPDDEYERYMLEEKGIFADVRKAEARYIPLHLKETLETTGFWGAVRLVPQSHVVDLRVGGVIIQSHGKKLEIDLIAVDAKGKKWLDETYKGEADPLAYQDEEHLREPFQNLYNEIANDLQKITRKMDAKDVQKVHRVSELRFASYLAPTAFDDYLDANKSNSKFKISRLPSYEDPMMVRLAEIRERDFMFVDTLNEYYSEFSMKMNDPYKSWRAFSYEEQKALDSLNKKKWAERILGAAAIAGGVIASQRGGGWGRGGSEVAILGGMAVIQDSFQKAEEAKMHREALRELAASFDSEVAPVLIDVEGEVMRLTGSVETQYETWRELLRQIFTAELGLPVDPNAAPVPATGERRQN